MKDGMKQLRIAPVHQDARGTGGDFGLRTEKDNAAATYAEDMVREMREDDLIDILEIEKRSFISPWTRRMFEETIESPISTNSVIEINSEILGYIMLYSVEDEAHIMNLAVHPDHRGRGYASKLITHTVSHVVRRNISEFFLEVRESNINAQRLYTKFGFKIIGKRKRYYTETNEDALVMHLSFSK